MTNKIYKVGGMVRDLFLGVEAKDKDFAVETDSFDSMRQIILDKGGKIFLETPQHFTIRATGPGLGNADYVLCRLEGPYEDGRHPNWVLPGTILDDLSRRDFTMNAIAINAENEKDVVDPHRGIDDIAFKFIRCVGNPSERFSEDTLRVFRAIRFAITKGFTITHDTEVAMEQTARFGNFDNVSTERIREEMLKMFVIDWSESYRQLRYFGLLPLIQQRGIWLKPTVEKR